VSVLLTVAHGRALAGPTEQQLFANTVAGAAVNRAAAQETLAEYAAAVSPSAPLTRDTGLDASPGGSLRGGSALLTGR